MSDSLRPHGLQPTRLLCPWDFPDKGTGVGCHCLLQYSYIVKSLSRVRLCDPMEGNLPRSAVHGIFQARILEWAAISFSRGSSQPRDRTRVSCIADRRFTVDMTYVFTCYLYRLYIEYLTTCQILLQVLGFHQ